MPRQIQGSQTDFSFGEVDPELKRSDDHPARKAGLRTMANTRILNNKKLRNRSGRRALYPITNGGLRTERLTMASGSDFDIQFSPNRVKIFNTTGTLFANFTTKGGGGALPWASAADIQQIVYAVFGSAIYITFGHSMRPQVISWDGGSTFAIADFNELVIGNQKRTPFYRSTPQSITMLPGAQSGNTTLNASAAYFVAGMIGTRLRFVNRQMLITGVTSSVLASVTIEESLPGWQSMIFAIDPSGTYSVGDVVIGSVTGSKGVVTAISSGTKSISIQLITANASALPVIQGTIGALPGLPALSTTTFAYTTADTVAGPGGGLIPTSVSVLTWPQSSFFYWDEEVMNDYRGYPASVFTDQFRVGFCDFPGTPGAIAWSAINAPTDLYVGAGGTASNAMFEIVPAKARVYHVVPGPESSEFIFCDRRIYYIPISPANPLAPGRVQFLLLSGDGSAQVQPRIAQEAIIYASAGQSSVMAIIATGAYLRPFNTKNLTDFHDHLFTGIQCIAAPSADSAFFSERYLYVLNSTGLITVGKYDTDTLTTGAPVIGWGPWTGAATVSWVHAHSADVIFTSSYFGNGVVEILDDAQYLDCALPVNAAPASMAPPGGKGPLWFIPSQSVTLMDQSTRMMGTYQIDANGFIIPQFNAGENLLAASLVAGQPWTLFVEPFAPDATSGVDMGQRMKTRQYSNFGAYVIHSTGFYFATLFSAAHTRTSPVPGSTVQTRQVTAWNMDDDPTLPPTQRETFEFFVPQGASYDPRAAIVKDTPGPLLICEIAMEISI